MTASSLAPAAPLAVWGPADPLVLAGFALLVGGVVGSVVPVVPGGLLSLAGVGAYWWATGEPGPVLLSGLVVLGVLALAADWLAGAVAAKAGGASTFTTVVATVLGLAGLVGAGPVGFLLVTAGTVFALELGRGSGLVPSARATGLTLLGMFASGAFQVVLTVGVLVVMAGVALL